MNKGFSLFIIILMFHLAAPPAGAQVHMSQSSSILDLTGPSAGEPLLATMDRALGQVMVHWPSDTVSYDQLQSIIKQFPGIEKLQMQFPNQSQWMLSPTELTNLYREYKDQAAELGFGADGGGIPDLQFSSLASHSGGLGALAMIPITSLKDGMAETLEPVLREMRYQQLALSDSLPDWLKDILLAMYNARVW